MSSPIRNMKVTIIGSGGYIRTPKPCCSCELCKIARKDIKERRLGPSVYINDIDLLIDTPEDIAEGLNYSNIKKVSNILYSHWHPDHTAGWRVIEQIQADIDIRSSSGSQNLVKPDDTINIFIPADLRELIIKLEPGIKYMEKCSFAEIKTFKDKINIKDCCIEAIELSNDIPSYLYLISIIDKKIVICMDHAKNIPASKIPEGVDLMIMPLGYMEEDLPQDHIRRQDTSFKENLNLIDILHPKQTVFVHIEELWRKRIADYQDLETQYKDKNLHFSIDGTEVAV
ncbi:hypothetical protein KJ652_04090 [Patescibacteria group bacterium]|nr:hypothetical protein [Patescibacteria group bacterium]MBU1123746.1 hypothetical protein [Patescibacteria group bacterium]MBU1910831.1 hypothetical protein [Patescibacteria group bacterium]